MKEIDDIDVYNVWTVGGTVALLLFGWFYLAPKVRAQTLPALETHAQQIDRY